MAKAHKRIKMSVGVGTPCYMPPEMFGGDDSDDENDGPSSSSSGANVLAVDVFALGIILWELWMRALPWEGKSVHKIVMLVGQKGKRPAFDMTSSPNGLLKGTNMDPKGKPIPPDSLVSLISACWAQLFVQRPSVHKVLESFEADVVPAIEAAKLVEASNIKQAAVALEESAKAAAAAEAAAAEAEKAAAEAEKAAEEEKQRQQALAKKEEDEVEARKVLKAKVKADFEAKQAAETQLTSQQASAIDQVAAGKRELN
jgi:serine/threonine protein kinase